MPLISSGFLELYVHYAAMPVESKIRNQNQTREARREQQRAPVSTPFWASPMAPVYLCYPPREPATRDERAA